MGLMLIGIAPGDEVILPSFTFTSTATAIVLHGGVPVFIDSRPDTLNINEDLIEAAVTPRTKVIIPVHYGGVSCDMERIMAIAEKHGLVVLEDAAQCIGAFQGDAPVGSQGHMSAFSFHETKNITSGEGGMLCINDARFTEKAEIVRDKGTNRQKFLRGAVDKYSWQDKGSSYLMSELQAAYLSVQLEAVDKVTQNRLETWNHYHQGLKDLEDAGVLRRPIFPETARQNAHVYYILLPTEEKRQALQTHLAEHDIYAVPHYVPLHSSAGGMKFGREGSDMTEVNRFSNCLLRLPLYYGIRVDERNEVIESIKIALTTPATPHVSRMH
jgi:dTDP-4-amino-4,6-dideoxygalactose transaminase